jgi:hypothetical protein
MRRIESVIFSFWAFEKVKLDKPRHIVEMTVSLQPKEATKCHGKSLEALTARYSDFSKRAKNAWSARWGARRKGKWTGGTVPLGYDAITKSWSSTSPKLKRSAPSSDFTSS